MSKIEIIPADDAVFNEPVAGLGDLLLFLFDLRELSRVANGNGACEPIGQFDLVELLLDSLPQFQIVDIAQDEQGFDDLTERFEGLIKRVLAGIGIEPPKDIGGCVLLELDSSDKPQKLIPVFADQRVIDSLVRLNFPIFFNPVFRFENIKGLLTDALDARGERKAQQMGEAENRFGVAVCVGGMDVAFDNIIVHETVDHISAFALCCADHE